MLRVLLWASLVAISVMATTGPSKAGVSCDAVGRLSYDAPMTFCMRTDIFIAAVGQITAQTPDEFLSFLGAVSRRGLRPESVTFHSPGGSLGAGIELGRIIRSLRLDTHVGKSSVCGSSCMLAFIGGWSRKVTHDGRIGNHQFKNRLREVDRVEDVQDLIARLAEYHREMNVSPLALSAAITRRADEMYWYSPQERAEWGIVTKR